MVKRTRAGMGRTRKPRRTSIKYRRTKVSRRRKISDIHTFKGIMNAGQLFAIPTSTSTHLGGQYISQLTDLPIIAAGGALSNSFDFVRLNKCKMEFMPKFNLNGGNLPVDAPTFLTGLDEVPIFRTTALTQASTWGTQADEDAGVTETKAYDHARITPDYIRGMQNSVETEIYKKHTVWFTPTFYDFTVNNVIANPTGLTGSVYKPCKKQWVNLNYLNQATGSEVQATGPDFYGPMYCFGTNTATITQYYDVKLHYSVSFRRLRGV